MDKIIREVFELKDVDADSYSPLTLAYIGDCVYELTIRTLLVNKGNAPVNKLNKKASDLAKAPTQSKMISMLVEMNSSPVRACGIQKRPQCQVLFHSQECHG